MSHEKISLKKNQNHYIRRIKRYSRHSSSVTHELLLIRLKMKDEDWFRIFWVITWYWY
jgi:hypothetical protein